MSAMPPKVERPLYYARGEGMQLKIEPHVNVASASGVLVLRELRTLGMAGLAAQRAHHLRVVRAVAFVLGRLELGEAVEHDVVPPFLPEAEHLHVERAVLGVGDVVGMPDARIGRR